MQPLSEQLAELSAQTKRAEDRVTKAQSETQQRLAEQRNEIRQEAEAALNRVNDSFSHASEGTKAHFAQLKSKVDSDFQRMKENASARQAKVEAWQANNYAEDKSADAQAAINYAFAAVTLAEAATLDAIDARLRADGKGELAQSRQVEASRA